MTTTTAERDEDRRAAWAAARERVIEKHDVLLRALADAPDLPPVNTVERDGCRIVVVALGHRFALTEAGGEYALGVMSSLLKSGREPIPFFMGGATDPTVGAMLDRPTAEFFWTMLRAVLDER